MDDSHNTYLLGFFRGGIRFDHIALTNAGAFVTKYDAAGNVVWAIQEGNPGWSAIALAVDHGGNVYAAYRTMTELSSAKSAGSDFNPMNRTSIFLAKYDVGGRRVWTKKIDGDIDFQTMQVLADSAGNCYWRMTASRNTTLGGVPVTIGGLIAKYDTDGNQVWVAQDRARLSYGTMAVDGSGNVFATGSAYGKMRVSAATLPHSPNEEVPSRDFTLMKYDPAGRLLFTRIYGGDHDEDVTGLATDPAGNCVAVGQYQQSFELGGTLLEGRPTNSCQFAAKFNGQGDVLWARKLHQLDDSDAGLPGTDASGNLYAVIRTRSSGFFLCKYDREGTFLWKKVVPGTMGFGFMVGPGGYCALAGEFLEPTLQIDSFTLVNPKRTGPTKQFFMAMLDTTSSPWAGLPLQAAKSGKPGVFYLGSTAGFQRTNSMRAGNVSASNAASASNSVALPTSKGKMIIQFGER